MVGVVVEVVCLQDHILKVSCHYLYFLLSYSCFLIKLLTCQGDDEMRDERQVILVFALPLLQLGKSYGWARAAQFTEESITEQARLFIHQRPHY